MTKKTKIWLYFALVLSASTTLLNLSYGRVSSVIIAVVSLIGLCILLFQQRKFGFTLMCVCYLMSFLLGVFESFQGGSHVAISIGMSFIGSSLIPIITYLFIRKEMDVLK